MLDDADRTSAAPAQRWVAQAQRDLPRLAAKYSPLLDSDAVPMRPERICHELTRHVPDDAIVVVDTGHAGIWTGGLFDLTSPQPELHPQRRPARLGVPGRARREVRLPDRPVVCFTGDGGFWYHIAELETAARWKINAVIVVNNNPAATRKRGFDRAYGGKQREQARELWTFTDVNFARIAEDMGASASASRSRATWRRRSSGR